MPGMRDNELPDGMVLRALRGRAGLSLVARDIQSMLRAARMCQRAIPRWSKKKAPASAEAFAFSTVSASACFRETALLTTGGISVDEAFARGAIEELHGLEPRLGGGARGGRLLECGAQGGALRAIPHRSGAGLPHVLFR